MTQNHMEEENSFGTRQVPNELFCIVACIHGVDHFLDHFFFQVDIQAQQTDKTKKLQEFAVILRDGGERVRGFMVAVHYAADRSVDLLFFYVINFLIDILEVEIPVRTPKAVCYRLQDCLNVGEWQEALEIIDEDQHDHMLPGITLLFRRR